MEHGRNMFSLSCMYGACFVIAHETGKVVDYAVMSKYCVGCRRWDGTVRIRPVKIT